MRDHLAGSQFATGTMVGRHTFPMRNRTMALLSDATIIIEASDKSGSLNQAWEALRLGRALFLAESLFTNQALAFPKELEHYGAQVLSDVTLDSLFAQLPRGRRDAPTEIPF